MEMEMDIPPFWAAVDFDFHGGSPSPCLSSTSTPRAFGTQFYFSAPTSPAHTSQIFHELEDFAMIKFNSSSASPPYPWDEKNERATPSRFPQGEKEVCEFAFDMHNREETRRGDILETYYDGGKIPSTMSSSPRSHRRGGADQAAASLNIPLLSPISPQSSKSQSKKPFWSTFLPKKRKDKGQRTDQERGRQRSSTTSSTSVSARREARSLSPARVSKYPWEEEHHQLQKKGQSALNPKAPSSSAAAVKTTTLPSTSKGSRRWRLKDFLLFRSASEGRTSDKDPFKKYATSYRKQEDTNTKSSIYQPTAPRRKGQVSAHEMHYTFNKAVSDDLKKKTFLPYKQGILGRLAINPTVHVLANGFGSLTHG
ncbi:hypothetical protein Dimus_025635 [Dionaea muscipula]